MSDPSKPTGTVPDEPGYDGPQAPRVEARASVPTGPSDLLTALGRYDRAAIDGLKDPGDPDRDEDYVPSVPRALYADAEYTAREQLRGQRFEAVFGTSYERSMASTNKAEVEGTARVPVIHRVGELPEGAEETETVIDRVDHRVPFEGKFVSATGIRIVADVDAELAEALGLEKSAVKVEKKMGR